MWHTGSVVTAQGFSCTMAGEVLVPHPGIKLTSPALQGRFVTIWTTREVQSHLFFNGWKTLHQLCSLPKGRAPSKAVSIEGTGSPQAILWLLQRAPHREVGFLNSRVHIGPPFTELWIHEGFQWLLTSLGVCRQNFRVVPDNADGDWGPRSIGEAL